MFDYKKPTTQMLGRWQPWHDGHTALFKKSLAETGQVVIMVRDVGGIIGTDAGGGRTEGQYDNPFKWNEVRQNIVAGLAEHGFTEGVEYVIMQVPNIVDISYGRGVGYVFEEEVFDDSINSISATKIREKLRKEGNLD